MTIYHFRSIQTELVCGACSVFFRGSSASWNTISIPWQIPVVVVRWQGERYRITLPISMKSIGVGSILSTLFTTAISHPSFSPLLNTIFVIISIPIHISIALSPLLAVALASVTTSTAASTTAPTSCALLLGLLYLGPVTRMQAIWSLVFAVTIFTWAFSLGHADGYIGCYIGCKHLNIGKN